jgi:hypothetical protein
VSETWLNHEQVAELTGLVQWAAQCRKLAKMGIPFQPNGAGRPLVEPAVVLTTPVSRKRAEPNWSALRGPSA